MLNMFTYGNNVRTTLSAKLALGATVVKLHDALPSGRNPSTDANELKPARFTIMDRANNPTHIEIIEATDVSGMALGEVTLTGVTRGLEGTTARAWPAGSIIVQAVTERMLNPSWSHGVSDHSDRKLRAAGYEYTVNRTWKLGNMSIPGPGGSPPGMLIDGTGNVSLGITANFVSGHLMSSTEFEASNVTVDGTMTSLGNTTLQPGEESGRVLISKMRISPGDAPVGASAPGTAGDIRVSGNYIYVCTSTNTWRRATLASW